MHYLKLLKGVVLLALFTCIPLSVCAQTSTDELLDGYVSAVVNRENATPYITKMNQLFKGYSESQQTAFREKIFSRITNVHTMEQKQEMALIDLYAMLATADDSRLDDLYFQKGEICGLHTGDTLMLKECITNLKLSDKSETEKVMGYVNTLTDYLEQIRNYLPASQRIDGIWVSNLYFSSDKYSYLGYTPYLVIEIRNGQVKMEPVGYGTLLSDISFWSEKVKNDERTYAQNVVDLGNEKVYMLWSNEQLKIPNQAIALSLGQTAGEITNAAVREGTSALIGNIGGNLAGGIAGNVIGGAIMDMFAPSKKMYVFELEIERINDYEFVGQTHIQTIKVDGGGKPEIKEDTKQEILFTKYDAASGVFFGVPGWAPRYVPGYGISKKGMPENVGEYLLKVNKKYVELIGLSPLSLENKSKRFCWHQLKKLQCYNEQKMLQEECRMSEKHHQPKVPFAAISMKPSDGVKGVLVDNVNKDYGNSSAYLFGIKKGDIITGIDGFEVESPQQLIRLIQSHKPFDWVTFQVQRGKKKKNIEVELSYAEQNKPEDQQ